MLIGEESCTWGSSVGGVVSARSGGKVLASFLSGWGSWCTLVGLLLAMLATVSVGKQK